MGRDAVEGMDISNSPSSEAGACSGEWMGGGL